MESQENKFAYLNTHTHTHHKATLQNPLPKSNCKEIVMAPMVYCFIDLSVCASVYWPACMVPVAQCAQAGIYKARGGKQPPAQASKPAVSTRSWEHCVSGRLCELNPGTQVVGALRQMPVIPLMRGLPVGSSAVIGLRSTFYKSRCLRFTPSPLAQFLGWGPEKFSGDY